MNPTLSADLANDHWPLISQHPSVQAHYETCRRAGTCHKLAEMFALASPPTCMTDAVFLEGHCNGSQFEDTPELGDYYAAEARAGGVDPKGKVYLSGLARFPGDPEAWVSSRSDVQKVCETRGWGCQGAVNVTAVDLTEPPPDVDVAPDIVEQRVMQKIDEDPSTLERDPGEVFHEAKQEIKPHWVA